MITQKEIEKVEKATIAFLQEHSTMFLKMEIDSLRNYLPLFENYVLTDDEKIKENIAQINKTLPEHLKNNPEYLIESIYYAKIRMTSMFRNSTFISYFSILENELSEISRKAKEYLRLQFGESDLKDKGIERSKNYLEKSLELKITDRDHWQKLKLYQSVRNALVHNKGRVKNSDDCSKIVNSLKGITKSADDYIYLSLDFIPNFLDILETFVTSLQIEAYAEIKNKYNPLLIKQ